MNFLSTSKTETTLQIPNFFSVFPGDIFAHTRRLEKVDLSRNKLKSLAGVFTDLFGLEEVFLNDNLLLSFFNQWFSNMYSHYSQRVFLNHSLENESSKLLFKNISSRPKESVNTLAKDLSLFQNKSTFSNQRRTFTNPILFFCTSR